MTEIETISLRNPRLKPEREPGGHLEVTPSAWVLVGPGGSDVGEKFYASKNGVGDGVGEKLLLLHIASL